MKKINFNWGFGIAATYIFFLIAVLIMVFIFMNQDVSLETNNYYTKGIEYQNHIDKVKRTEALPEQLEIQLTKEEIHFSFPKIFQPKNISGLIQFYRPADKSKDFSFKIAADSLNVQKISTSSLEKGLWKIRIEWNANGESFYNEKILMVN